MKVTNVFKKTTKAFNDKDIRLIVSYGGSSSSKTISILQLLLIYALKHSNIRIRIFGETRPKVEDTVFADFQSFVLDLNGIDLSQYLNKTSLKYTLPNRSIIHFTATDKESKAKGMRQHIAYFDEVNHIKKSVFDQVSIRTKHKILVSYNPSSKFWLMDEFDRENLFKIHSTYKDNQFVEDEIIKELEEKGRRSKNFKRVYLEGKLGVSEGLIFEEDVNYCFVDEMPNKKIIKVVIGIDFGWNDPTAIMKLTVFDDNSIYVEELLYESGLTATKIVERMNILKIDKKIKIIAESARPEIIDVIYAAGYNIHSVKKPKLEDRIPKQLLFFMYVNSNCTHYKDELYNYTWKEDKNGNALEVPIDAWNHGNDAIGYAQTDIKFRRKSTLSVEML